MSNSLLTSNRNAPYNCAYKFLFTTLFSSPDANHALEVANAPDQSIHLYHRPGAVGLYYRPDVVFLEMPLEGGCLCC